MKHYGLLGEHLSHSYSKMIHTSIFKALNINADYSLIECKREELITYIQALKQGVYCGFNVTIPYKKEIMKYLDSIDEKAQGIGSVNTIYCKDGKIYGTNTDYDGFLFTLKKYQIDVNQKECYILGTGGASLAVHKVLKDLGGQCYFVSRTPNDQQIGYADLQNKKIDLLVNTTPVGMFPNVGVSPISKELAQKANVVIDIIFNPSRTQLLLDANSNMNGLNMLIMQAIVAEEIWQNQKIDISVNKLIVDAGLQKEMIQVNETNYEVIRLLGKGKGGYSYLVTNGKKYFVLKQIHHEPCSYYAFGNKIDAELRDYNTLKQVGVPMPCLLDVDIPKERILKEYIDGSTIYDLVLEDKVTQDYFTQINRISDMLYKFNLNIDYFPTNFVVQDGKLFYIDYECNSYMEEWNFNNWGIKYWSRTEAFMQYVKEKSSKE